jgi:hypothetical protein
MDVVYICRFHDNNELKYSLRSLVNMNHDDVFIVGGKPTWYTGNYEEVRYTGSKYSHARANLEAIINNPNISDDFILMNDDFIIVKPIGDLQVYNEGLLKDKIDRYNAFAPRSNYTKMLKDTYQYLLSRGIQKPLCYDLHVPMVMNKKLLSEALNTKKLWRSTYGNLNNIGGETIDDVKVYSLIGPEPRIDYLNSDLPFLSTQDDTFEEVKNNLLHELFPNKSQYEK